MLKLKFKEFVKLREMNTVGRHNDGPGGAFLSSDQTGSEAAPDMEGNPLHLPSIDLQIPSSIPTMTKTSVIRVVERNKNPIFVHLDDGTKLHFTWDEFKRIEGKEPSPGKKLYVVLLRREDDKREEPSQVQRALCF
jgi:hypothetical protein